MAGVRRGDSPWWSRIVGVSLLLATLLSACAAWYTFSRSPLPATWYISTAHPRDDVAMVVAAIQSENTSWVHDLPVWRKHIYVTDDDDADPLVPMNAGKESMVYLTFIIDHWASLPSITLFSHGLRYQWHNDDPMYDGARVLQRLQLPLVRKRGYVSLRCQWDPGCPVAVRPYKVEPEVIPTFDIDAELAYYWKGFLEHIFPDEPIPEAIGAPCCAQFAVTDWQIRQRPKHFYEKLRRWVLIQPDNGIFSGRIMEHAWHIIFGQEALHCEDPHDCYCATFGICDLECEDYGECKAQNRLPLGQVLPEGWPNNSTAIMYEYPD